MPDPNQSILLFDGICKLCNRFAKFVIRKDHQQKFIFGTIQSESGQSILMKYGLTEKGMDTMVLIQDNKIYLRSDAVIKIIVGFGRLWPLIKITLLIPRPVRDWIYNIIAKNRYRIFGKEDQCMVPGPDVKNRFIE